jgi:hypothetical protein
LTIAETLAALDISKDSLIRLGALVWDEHRAAPIVPPVLPLVYRASDRTSPAQRRSETRARRTCYQIDKTLSGKRVRPGRSPTDQIFFVPGEPDERSLTKVAGLPYRAASVPWPVTEEGRPMTFLAQFCLAESKDLIGKLPGDVLLMFAEDRDAYLPNPYGTTLRFEWYPLGLRDLIDAEDIPDTEWKLRPYFGVLHRTDDKRLVGNPQGETKIGGAPAWIQGDESRSGRFLCELGRLQNVPQPWDRWNNDSRRNPHGEELTMSDAGCLYFFGSSAESVGVFWLGQCSQSVI